MGSTPRGILFYGFPLADTEDESPLFPWGLDEYEEDDSGGWEKAYFSSVGLENLSVDHTRFRNDTEYNAEVRTYWYKRNEAKARLGVDIGFAGYDGYTSYYLSAYSCSSEWGAMTIASMEIKPEWNEKIKHFCEMVGIEYQQPAWYLTSLYF